LAWQIIDANKRGVTSMIDLEAVRKLQLERIEKQIEAERGNKLRSYESLAADQRQRLIDAELGREKAEEGFPDILLNLEKNIAVYVNSGLSSFTYGFSGTVRDTYIVKMLLDVLPLHGFVCRIKDGNLEISW
jgi:hypothetical protein